MSPSCGPGSAVSITSQKRTLADAPTPCTGHEAPPGQQQVSDPGALYGSVDEIVRRLQTLEDGTFRAESAQIRDFQEAACATLVQSMEALEERMLGRLQRFEERDLDQESASAALVQSMEALEQRLLGRLRLFEERELDRCRCVVHEELDARIGRLRRDLEALPSSQALSKRIVDLDDRVSSLRRDLEASLDLRFGRLRMDLEASRTGHPLGERVDLNEHGRPSERHSESIAELWREQKMGREALGQLTEDHAAARKALQEEVSALHSAVKALEVGHNEVSGLHSAVKALERGHNESCAQLFSAEREQRESADRSLQMALMQLETRFLGPKPPTSTALSFPRCLGSGSDVLPAPVSTSASTAPPPTMVSASHLACCGSVSQPIAVGDQVEAIYLGGQWHPAEITEVQADSHYVIRWEDGGISDCRKSAHEIRRLLPASLPPTASAMPSESRRLLPTSLPPTASPMVTDSRVPARSPSLGTLTSTKIEEGHYDKFAVFMNSSAYAGGVSRGGSMC